MDLAVENSNAATITGMWKLGTRTKRCRKD